MLYRHKKERVANLFTSISCRVVCPCKAHVLTARVLRSCAGIKAWAVPLEICALTRGLFLNGLLAKGDVQELMSLLRKPMRRYPFIYHEIYL